LTRVFEHVREHGHLYKSPHNTPSNLFTPHQHLQLLTFLLITLLVAAVTMRFTQAIALVLPALAAAYPGMAGSRAEMEEHFRAQMKREAEAEADPQLLNGLGNLVNSLGDSVKGLLNSVGQAIVVKSNKRPEPGFDFQAPGPGDSRGPCPGLNTLANHGYLPRNGYVNMGQVIEATARGFNMGTDLSTVLTVFAILADGDFDTLSWYLGAGKNKVGGLNRHSTVEADISPNREGKSIIPARIITTLTNADYYNGCGDNHHLSSRLVKDMVNFAKDDPKKEFSIDVMAKHYAKHADFSKKNNPYLYYFPFPQIVSVVAFNFYPRFFSNGTSEAGGVANYKSIMPIIGAEYDEKSGEFKYVPERFPENWYRRATPYGAVVALTEGFTEIYPRNIVVPAVAQIGTPNLSVKTVLCDVYQGINSITPILVAGGLETTSKAATWAAGVLEPILGKSALGCPNSVLSPNYLYPEATREGGPQTPPRVASDKWTGDNVYNKVYFKTAPESQQCSH
jgi:hypothetical protein